VDILTVQTVTPYALYLQIQHTTNKHIDFKSLLNDNFMGLAFSEHTTLCLKKNVLTLKRYSSKLQGAILMKFGRNIQNTLE